MSPDGGTLLILTSGYNVRYDERGNLIPQDSGEYVFVYDITAQPPKKTQVVQVPRAFNGLAWNPNGNEFYVSGGEQDVVHAFGRQGAVWHEVGAPVRLGHSAGLGLAVPPEVAGIAVNAAGTRLVAANYENDSISVVDLGSRAKIAELDLRPGRSDPSKRARRAANIRFGWRLKAMTRPTSPAFATERSWSWRWGSRRTRRRVSSRASPCAARPTR